MSDDAIISFAQRLKQRDDIAVGNVGSALTSPDKAGRANVLARDFSVPTDFAERNLDALEREARRGGAVDLIARYPGVADWFANPRNAAVATDDIGSLATVAKTLKRRVPGQAAIENEVPPVANFRNFFKGVWTNLVEGGKSAKAGFSAIAADIVPAPTRRSGIPQLGDFALENAMQRRARAQLAIDAARPDFGSGWKARTLSGLYSGTASAAQMAPGVAIGALTGGAGGALTLAAPVGLDAYGKYRSRGASPGMAGVGAAGEAGVEAVTEILPMKFIVDRLGRIGFGSFARGLLGREIPGEQLATIAQDAIDTAIANPDKTWAEYLAERPDAAYETFVATLVPGALAGGSSEIARNLHLREQATQAETDAAFLQRLAGNVAESKVAKRDPSAFARFLEMQAQGSPVENVYIPGDALREFFQSADMDYRGDDSPFSFDPGIADQVEEAIATGGDVVIPTAQFATHLAGSPAWEALKDHVRLSPGGVSLAEAREFADAADEAMAQMGEEFAARSEADRAAQEPRTKLYQAVRDRLTNAGFTQSAADTNAAIVTARYATRAARQGKAIVGDEFDPVEVKQVLPERLAPIVAADQLDIVIDAMKRARSQRSGAQKFGPSLLEWIAVQGGIEDKGGDLAAMDVDRWHKGKVGRRKLIRPHDQAQASFIPSGQQNANTPDELALRAQEAGYFPAGERPSIDTLFEAIDAEMRGKPIYAEDRSGQTDQVREAADELAQLLDQEGLDPATASKGDILQAVQRYQAERSEGRGYDQGPPAFIQAVDVAWKGEKTTGFINVGPAPAALTRMGLPAKPLKLGNGKVGLIARKHEIGVEVLRHLPALMADPLMVFPSTDAGKPGALVVVLDAVDTANRRVIAAVGPNGEVNTIFSVYGKDGRGAKSSDDVVRDMADAEKRKGNAVYERKAPPGRYAGPIPAISPARQKKPILGVRSKSNSLDQSFMDGPRGRITFSPGGRTVIELFEARDPSTFLHESAHLWLEELRADAEAEGATDQVKADWTTVQAWFKANGHDLNDGIPVDAHEMWARGVERFVMEGKAPSSALRKVFDSFRAWLINIYQVVANLRSPITPEIRDVMARLIATDAEIDEARDEQHIKALWSTATAAGMSDEVFAQYQKLTQDARDEAHDALLYRTMATIRRERTKAWREERDSVQAEVAARVDARPEFRALALMRSKDARLRLDRAWLVETYGEDALALLPKGVPPIFADKNTAAADEIAEMAGFVSGDEMVRTLMAVGARTADMRAAGDARSVRQAMIEDQTAATMRERHGDPLSDGSIEEEALALIHNDRQGEVIASELRELGRRSNRRPTPYALARQWAAETIAQSKVADSLSGAALQRYARAARNAGKLAEEAMLAGNVDETYRQKQRQMLNNALVAEAGKAKALVDAAAARLSKVAKRATMRSVDQDYLDQAHALLEHVDFRQRSQRSIDRQESFEAWATAQREAGNEVYIPERFEYQGTHWSRLTVESLLGMRDVVDSILHLGRLKQTLVDNKARRDFEDWRADALAHLEATPGRRLSLDRNEQDTMLRGLLTEGLKVENFAQEMDNDQRNGPWTRLLATRATEVENHREEMRDRALYPVAALYNTMSDKQKDRLSEKITAPEIPYRSADLNDPRNGEPSVFTRWEILGMALNMGTESNLDKMARGEGVDQSVFETLAMRALTKADWDFVQSVWDALETLKPDIAATEKDMSGIEPEWLPGRPIETPHGTYRGGYFPIVYDPARSPRAEQNEIDAANDLFGNKSGVATARGHTISRTSYAAPILFSPEQVLFQHVEKVITRAAYAPWVRDVLKVMGDPSIRSTIDRKFGPEFRQMIRPWLQRQVNAGSVDPRASRWVEKFLRSARINMSLVAMGFRFSTGVAQTVGLANSIGRIGPNNMRKGLQRLLLERGDAVQFVFDRSPEMERRNQSINREVAEAFQQMRVARTTRGVMTKAAKVQAKAQAWAFWHIGMVDRYMVAIPTWLGAYEKGVSEGMSDADASAYADKIVRTTQGSGREKDLSKIQSPNSNAMRFFTMFYTPFNVLANAQWEAGRAVKRGDWRKAAMMTFWFMAATPLLDALVSGDVPDDDDESWAAWIARNIGFYLTAGVPLLRDAGNYAERKIAGDFASFNPGPLVRIWDATSDLASDAWDVTLGDGEASDRWLRHAIETPGYFLGLPTGQAAATSQYLWDVSEGKVEPETVSDWYWGLTKGRTKED